MYETYIHEFLALANRILTAGVRLMVAGSSDILHLSAIALILFLLAARMVQKRGGSFFQSFLAGKVPQKNRASDRFFERKRTVRLKTCPNCAEQLRLSALVCDACDYNFLAARPLRAQRSLPPPKSTRKPSRRRVASAGRRHH